MIRHTSLLAVAAFAAMGFGLAAPAADLPTKAEAFEKARPCVVLVDAKP